MPLVLYLFGGVLAVRGLRLMFVGMRSSDAGWGSLEWLFAVTGGLSPSLPVLAAKILVLVGLAQVLGRVLAMIDEQKTLV